MRPNAKSDLQHCGRGLPILVADHNAMNTSHLAEATTPT